MPEEHQTIDSTLGLRCTMFGYQYSEILCQPVQDRLWLKTMLFWLKPAYYLKSLYGVRGFGVYDVSVMQGICTIKEFLSFYKQNPTKSNRLRI